MLFAFICVSLASAAVTAVAQDACAYTGNDAYAACECNIIAPHYKIPKLLIGGGNNPNCDGQHGMTGGSTAGICGNWDNTISNVTLTLKCGPNASECDFYYGPIGSGGSGTTGCVNTSSDQVIAHFATSNSIVFPSTAAICVMTAKIQAVACISYDQK
jgi:hypothetical protein